MAQHPTHQDTDTDPEPEPLLHGNWVFDQEDEDFKPPENPNKFVFDENNGGGRRHRQHNVSRIAHLRGGEDGLRDCAVNLFSTDTPRAVVQEDDEAMPFERISEAQMEESPNMRVDQIETGMGIPDALLEEDGEAKLLPKMDLEEARNPHMNPIDGATLAKLMQGQNQPYMIVDARFEYEFNAGHIRGAVNISDPQALEDHLLAKERILSLLQSRTILIFHCEFT